MSEASQMGPRWYLTALFHWRWLIAGVTVAAALLALVIDRYVPPVFSATTTLLVKSEDGGNSTELNTLAAGERLAHTYSEMLTGHPVLTAVIEGLDLSETPEELLERLTVTPVEGTQLIRLTVTHSNAQEAAVQANTIAETFRTYLQQLTSQHRNGTQAERLEQELAALASQIEDDRAELAALRAQAFESNLELTRLQTDLTGARSDLQALVRDQATLEAGAAADAAPVTIVEAAHVPVLTASAPYTATVTLLAADASMNPTYGQLLLGWPVLEEAIARLALQEAPSQVLARTRVVEVPNTRLLRLEVSDDSSDGAIKLGNMITRVFTERVRELGGAGDQDLAQYLEPEREALVARIAELESAIKLAGSRLVQNQIAQAEFEALLATQSADADAVRQQLEVLQQAANPASGTLVVAEEAEVPVLPMRRQPLLTVLATSLGLVVGMGSALMLESLNDKIRTPEDVALKLRGNTVGAIGRLSGAEKLWPVGDGTLPERSSNEAFQVLATNLQLAQDGPATLLITSPGPGDGKTFIAANLALALAERGLQVVLVDADLRRPRLHQLFGLRQDSGFSRALQDGNVMARLQLTAVEGLRVISSGPTPAYPARLLVSPLLTDLLNALNQEADVILLDSPPVLSVADATILAPRVHGVLLVLRAGHTQTRAANDTIDRLLQVGASVVGIALNLVEQRRLGYYGYSDYAASDSSRARRWWQRLRGSGSSTPEMPGAAKSGWQFPVARELEEPSGVDEPAGAANMVRGELAP